MSVVTELVAVPFTLGGSAASGVDFSGVTAGPLLFGIGQTTVDITGKLLHDPGPDRTLTFTLGTPIGAPPWAVPRRTRLPSTSQGQRGRGEGTGTSTSPTITGERVVLTFLKHNKKGKPIGKPVVSFVFQFSTAMDMGTAGDADNYQVDSTSTKKVKKHRVTVLHPFGFSATYDPSTDSVTLATSSKQKTFAKGGLITINASPPGGVSSAAGAFLTGTTVFTIFAKAASLKSRPSGVSRITSAPMCLRKHPVQ